MSTLLVKRGDDVVLDCAVAGDLTGWGARSQIRLQSGRLLAECDVSDLVYDDGDEVTRYALTVASAVTETWPVSHDDIDAQMDIEYTDPDGLVQSTETITIRVSADVTRPVST